MRLKIVQRRSISAAAAQPSQCSLGSQPRPGFRRDTAAGVRRTRHKLRRTRPLEECAVSSPRRQLGNIQELAGSSVRFGRVETQLAAKLNNVAYQLGESANRDILAPTHVDEVFTRVVAHQEDACIGEIVGVQETPGAAFRSPRSSLRRRTESEDRRVWSLAAVSPTPCHTSRKWPPDRNASSSPSRGF